MKLLADRGIELDSLDSYYGQVKTMSSDSTEKISNQIQEIVNYAQEHVSRRVDMGRETVAGFQKTISENEYTQMALELGTEFQSDPVTFLKKKAEEVRMTIETTMPEELVQEGKSLIDRLHELRTKILDQGIQVITIDETKALLFQVFNTLLTVAPESMKHHKFSVETDSNDVDGERSSLDFETSEQSVKTI